jgi:hypothetical protein
LSNEYAANYFLPFCDLKVISIKETFTGSSQF